MIKCSAEGCPSGLRSCPRNAVRSKAFAGSNPAPSAGLVCELESQIASARCGLAVLASFAFWGRHTPRRAPTRPIYPMYPEESHRGLVGATGNRVCDEHRGFESHLLRHSLQSLCRPPFLHACPVRIATLPRPARSGLLPRVWHAVCGPLRPASRTRYVWAPVESSRMRGTKQHGLRPVSRASQ